MRYNKALQDSIHKHNDLVVLLTITLHQPMSLSDRLRSNLRMFCEAEIILRYSQGRHGFVTDFLGFIFRFTSRYTKIYSYSDMKNLSFFTYFSFGDSSLDYGTVWSMDSKYSIFANSVILKTLTYYNCYFKKSTGIRGTVVAR